MASGGDFGESESGEIGGQDSILVGKAWHQLPILKRGCREPMQQEHCRGNGWSGLSIKDAHAIGLDTLDGCARHKGPARPALSRHRGRWPASHAISSAHVVVLPNRHEILRSS